MASMEWYSPAATAASALGSCADALVSQSRPNSRVIALTIRMGFSSNLFNAAGAFLEVGLLGNRIGGIERALVDQHAGIESRNKHQAIGKASCRERWCQYV